jgi:hypothetical protein
VAFVFAAIVDFTEDGNFAERFRREADLTASLWHPHIVAVRETVENELAARSSGRSLDDGGLDGREDSVGSAEGGASFGRGHRTKTATATITATAAAAPTIGRRDFVGVSARRSAAGIADSA